MPAVLEALPVHPRRSSASRRRHHTQLPYRLRQIAPGAVTILVTPIWTDSRGPAERTYLARALDAHGRIVKFPAGGSRRIAALLQGSYPAADWNRPQTWTADTNQIAERRPLTNAEMRAAIQRMEERATGLEVEVAFQRERNFELVTARDFADSLRSGYVDRVGLEAS
jgi:hypothetical protein